MRASSSPAPMFFGQPFHARATERRPSRFGHYCAAHMKPRRAEAENALRPQRILSCLLRHAAIAASTCVFWATFPCLLRRDRFGAQALATWARSADSGTSPAADFEENSAISCGLTIWRARHSGGVGHQARRSPLHLRLHRLHSGKRKAYPEHCTIRPAIQQLL